MNNIKFDHISVLYENKKGNIVTAVDDISFSIQPNTFNIIIGPSGSGKSTLLKCLTGELVSEGKIYFGDKDLEDIPIKDRKISYMSQDYIVYPSVNVYDNIAFPLKIMKVDREEMDQIIKDIAHKLDIDLLLTRKCKYLSIGQISRVALAKALVKNSDLYIFDEPVKNLDIKNQRKVNDLIKKQLKEAGNTVIYVTHDINEVMYLADYIYVLKSSKSIEKYTPEELLKSTDNEVLDLLKPQEYEEEN